MKGYLKPGCVLSGTQYPGAAPCGTNAPTKRVGSAFAWAAVAPRAGSIDSRKGSAIVAPTPRRNVRRGIFRFVRKYIASLTLPANDEPPELSMRYRIAQARR